MRTTTIVVIVAAAAAGIIAGAVLLVTPVARSAEQADSPQEIIIGGETTPDNSTDDGYRQVNVTVNGVNLVADVAETNEQRSKGLTVKDTLGENESMLFVFETSQKYPFWMPPEMKFPIDIMWLDSNKTVVYIEESAQPCEIYPPISCPNYVPDEDAQYVLETVAGFARKYNVIEGTQVKFDDA